MVWLKCKRLHELGNVTNFYISSGTIKVKITENSSPIVINIYVTSKACSKVPFSEGSYHTETTPVICSADWLTGFSVM